MVEVADPGGLMAVAALLLILGVAANKFSTRLGVVISAVVVGLVASPGGRALVAREACDPL